MSTEHAVVRFLTGLAQAVSTMTLYTYEHPAVKRAVEDAYERLHRLQEDAPTPRITFLDGEVVFEARPLGQLKDWEWSARLASAGFQRLEFTGPVSMPDFEEFVTEVYARLASETSSVESRPSRPTQIRFGSVSLRGDSSAPDPDGSGDPVPDGLDLRHEAAAVGWLHEQMSERGSLSMAEADAVIRSLAVAMHADQHFVMPLLELKHFDQYTTTHALNVSVLAMGLAEKIGLAPHEVRRFGTAGLLHDLGKVKIPKDVLNKPGKLNERELALMRAHPVEGARLLLKEERALDLAAVVAYEHHLRIDGGGYPERSHRCAAHKASDLVHICDVYDALRSERPYRAAWEHDRVIAYLLENTGTELDPALTRAFAEMMQNQHNQVVRMDATEAMADGSPVIEAAGDVEIELNLSAWPAEQQA